MFSTQFSESKMRNRSMPFAAARATVGRDGVVVGDQGEELVTVCNDTERREAFVRVLAEHARGGAVICPPRNAVRVRQTGKPAHARPTKFAFFRSHFR